MDRLVTDVGLALYTYLEGSKERPTAESFHRFLNGTDTIEFLGGRLKGVEIRESRDQLGPDAEQKPWANVGISALQLFVAYNWIGYGQELQPRLLEILEAAFPEPDRYLELTEECYQKVRHKRLLCLAKYALVSSLDQEEKPTATLIWELRYLTVHQLILDSPSMNLYKRIKRNIASLGHFIDAPSHLRERLLRTQLSVEISQILLWYREVGVSKLYLENALKFSGLSLELSGALGVRTRFQEKATSQLLIKIERKSEDKVVLERLEAEPIVDSPKNVLLNDDTLLEDVRFSTGTDGDGNERRSISLFPEEESLVLAVACHLKRAGAFGDELVEEELGTYVAHILSTSAVWSVRFKALLIRSLLERSSRRKVERSMMQLDHLVSEVALPAQAQQPSASPRQDRLQLFYATLPDPIWVIEKHLADVLLSLGSTKSALEIYERIHSWKDMIICYSRLGRKHHAEEVIRAQLSKEETPYLWCLLGDATDNIEYYEKSWTQSNERYFKAQTALGDFYFERKDYKRCIGHYQQSLKLNSLQVNTWQRLAYAALDGEDYQEAARAYRRYLEFELDAFEAWNNLSKAYIKLGSKERAYRTLMEAIKWNYEQYRLWENFMLVAIDVGSFEETIVAWHRLIDIKGKHEDDEVIEILCNAVATDVTDLNGNGSARLSKKLLQLLARIAATNYSSPRLWLAYGRFLHSQNGDNDRIIDCLQKSNRAAIQDPAWHKQPTSNERVVKHCTSSLRFYREQVSGLLSAPTKTKTDATLRLAYNNIAKAAAASVSTWDSSKPNVEAATTALDQFQQLISSSLPA